MEANPFRSLLSALGDPMTSDRLKRMIRTELIPTKDFTTKLSSLEVKLKNLSSIPPASRDPNWHARISELTLSAATQTMNRASDDAFVALAIGTGYTMTVLDLQGTFRKVWNNSCDRWLDLPKEAREQVEEHILENMVLPAEASEVVECRRKLRGLINEAGKKSWVLMKRRLAVKKRKRKNEGGSLDDGCRAGIVTVGEEGGKRKRTEIEGGSQNGGNSEEEGRVRKRSIRGRKREPMRVLVGGMTVPVERDEATKNNPGIASDKEEPAEQLRRDEEIRFPPQIGSNKKEKREPKRDEKTDGAQDVAHGQEEADVLRAEEKEAGITKRETEKLENAVQTSETAEPGLGDRETNEIKTIERESEVIVILSDDEQPRKVERAGKMPVIEIGSEDEWDFNQPEELLHPSEPEESLHPSEPEESLHPSEPEESLHPTDSEDSEAYFDYFGQ